MRLKNKSDLALNSSRSGNPKNPPLVFLHGWPDDESVWDELVADLSRDYFCVRISLPWFAPGDEQARPANFKELIARLKDTVVEVLRLTSAKQVTLVGHDWGAFITYMFEREHSPLVRAIATFDVGGRMQVTSLKQGASIAAYQGWLITAWKIRTFAPKVADQMSQKFARLARAPHPERVTSRMNYLYAYLWSGALRREPRESLPPDYAPRVPAFYCYGGKKPFMFHSAAWLRLLEENPDCRVLCLPKSGHWMMKSEPDRIATALREWLAGLQLSGARQNDDSVGKGE